MLDVMPSNDTSPILALHFADVHFGVETYGRYDAATGLSTRLLDFRAALMAGIDEALRRGVEIALFAGDAYKARDPSQTHQRAFADCLNALTFRRRARSPAHRQPRHPQHQGKG